MQFFHSEYQTAVQQKMRFAPWLFNNLIVRTVLCRHRCAAVKYCGNDRVLLLCQSLQLCLKAACVCGVNVPLVIVCEVHATCNLVLLACFATSALCACACVANMHVFLCVQQSSSAACHLLQQKSTSADLLLLPLHTPSPPHSNIRVNY